MLQAITTQAPSPNKLPAEPDDLQSGQFRLGGRTYENGGITYYKRRYFVQEREVFPLTYRYDDAGRCTIVFCSDPDEDIWNIQRPCDEAVITNGEEETALRLCLDETILKFAVAG